MVFEEYVRFNAAANDIFFDGRFNSKPVYIDLEDHAARELARKLDVAGHEVETLIALTVHDTLLVDANDPYAWHRKATQSWIKEGRTTPPPFTGLLTALSLAADKMREDAHFSATNYYERLFETLEITNATFQNKLKHHAKSTRLFWRELNHWLTEHDFQLGRPTARQVNSWPYVSYAISQALVRDADRNRFHDLFKEFDLSPIDEVSESEMVLYLHDWMTGQGPNNWLRRLWQSPDLRERIAAAALSELEHWDGGRHEGGNKHRRLNWTAYFQAFPRKRLDLMLTTVNAEATDVELSIPPGASPATRKAFEGVEGNPRLAVVPTGDFSALEPTRDIDLCALLVASCDLRRDDGDTYTHVARPIIPLARLDTGPYYREVQRVALLRRHAVLCHEQWRDKVDAHLQKCARPGYGVWTPDDLPGLPPTWVMFEDVEVTRVLDGALQNLAALVPLSEGVAIQLDGGLRLAPQIWHSEAPPNIVATSDSGAFKLVLRSLTAISDSDVFEVLSAGGNCSITLAPSDDLPTELSAVAVRQSQEKGERNFALRDGAVPRPLRDRQGMYSLDPGNAVGFVSAAHFVGDGQLHLQGMHLVGPPAADIAGEFGSLVYVDQEPEDENQDRDYKFATLVGLAETCTIRGHHYWICDEAKKGDVPWEAKRMECKDCKNSVILRNRVRRNAAPLSRTVRAISTPVAPVPVEKSRSLASMDLLFDGLCYLGTGSWSSLQSLASARSDDIWFTATLASELEDLGHFDVQRDGAGRVTNWAVAPPALVVAPGGRGYLAGFRNRTLVDDVGDALEELDCEYAPEKLRNSLSREAWHGIDFEAASQVCDGIRDPHGRSLSVVRAPAASIASRGATLDAMIAAATPVHLECKDGLQRFIPREGRWRYTDAASEPGAYRTNFAGRRYFVCDDSGNSRGTSHAIAKIFAARTEGVALHGYDSSTRRLFGSLGCSLPGLYSRAAVSCSGHLPAVDKRRFYHGDVPPDVAFRILFNLYGKP